MRAVGIKTLNSRLSEYVRLAARGETVLVTDRDRVVAELTPPNPQRCQEVADSLLSNAMREGWIRPPLIGIDQPPPSPQGIAGLDRILSELDRDRRDR